MFKFAIAIVAATLTAAVFGSNAEARSGGSFYASPFFRNQGRQPAIDPSIERRRKASEYSAARARARKLEAARKAAREQAATRQAAVARRARLLEQQRREAAKDTAEKNATSVPRATASTTSDQPAAKREDRLPTVVASEPTTKSTTTASATTPTTAKSGLTPNEVKPAARVCRKYSAAADGLVETPCN